MCEKIEITKAMLRLGQNLFYDDGVNCLLDNSGGIAVKFSNKHYHNITDTTLHRKAYHYRLDDQAVKAINQIMTEYDKSDVAETIKLTLDDVNHISRATHYTKDNEEIGLIVTTLANKFVIQRKYLDLIYLMVKKEAKPVEMLHLVTRGHHRLIILGETFVVCVLPLVLPKSGFTELPELTTYAWFSPVKIKDHTAKNLAEIKRHNINGNVTYDVIGTGLVIKKFNKLYMVFHKKSDKSIPLCESNKLITTRHIVEILLAVKDINWQWPEKKIVDYMNDHNARQMYWLITAVLSDNADWQKITSHLKKSQDYQVTYDAIRDLR